MEWLKIGGVVVLVGCASPAAAPAPAPVTPSASAIPSASTSTSAIPSTSTIPCETAIDAIATPPESYTSVLDVVALPTGKQLDVNDREGTLFSKAGLVVPDELSSSDPPHANSASQPQQPRRAPSPSCQPLLPGYPDPGSPSGRVYLNTGYY